MNEHVWVIHDSLSGNSSVQLLLFTREHGLVKALYKGGLHPKKRSLLQAFTPLWVDMTERQGWHYVRRVELAAPSLPLARYHLYSALYLNELLYHALRPLDHVPQIYDAYVATLHLLSQSTGMSMLECALRRFEWTLLVSMGYEISLTHDAQSALPLAVDGYYTLRVGQGLVRTERGMLGADLLAVAEDRLDDPAVLKTAKRLMRQTIDHAIGGKEIKARRFYTYRTYAKP